MCKKEKYEKHRNVLVFFLNLRNARYSYFSETVLRNPKHLPLVFLFALHFAPVPTRLRQQPDAPFLRN